MTGTIQALETAVGMASNGWKPYPAYKGSGVEWLGSVPDHWEVRRIKTCFGNGPTRIRMRLMLRNDSPEYLVGLVRELCKLPHEVEWVEFKSNDAEPQAIGEYISALSNSAAMNGKVSAYLLWGVNNETHDIEGTTFRPNTARKGNQPLESWLLQLLDPKIHFRFHEIRPLLGMRFS